MVSNVNEWMADSLCNGEVCTPQARVCKILGEILRYEKHEVDKFWMKWVNLFAASLFHSFWVRVVVDATRLQWNESDLRVWNGNSSTKCMNY